VCVCVCVCAAELWTPLDVLCRPASRLDRALPSRLAEQPAPAPGKLPSSPSQFSTPYSHTARPGRRVSSALLAVQIVLIDRISRWNIEWSIEVQEVEGVLCSLCRRPCHHACTLSIPLPFARALVTVDISRPWKESSFPAICPCPLPLPLPLPLPSSSSSSRRRRRE
jgi:hypothetical protein